MAHTPTETSRPTSAGRTGLAPAWDRMRAAAAGGHPVHATTSSVLVDTEPDVLDFEARTWPRGGEKLAAIRASFGWSETRYYQVLRDLLDRPAALEHAPAVVLRLRLHLEVARPTP